MRATAEQIAEHIEAAERLLGLRAESAEEATAYATAAQAHATLALALQMQMSIGVYNASAL